MLVGVGRSKARSNRVRKWRRKDRPGRGGSADLSFREFGPFQTSVGLENRSRKREKIGVWAVVGMGVAKGFWSSFGAVCPACSLIGGPL